jgi:hypothetical protein
MSPVSARLTALLVSFSEAALPGASAGRPKTPDRPDVLCVSADHWGRGEARCCGHPILRTLEQVPVPACLPLVCNQGRASRPCYPVFYENAGLNRTKGED